MNQHDGQGENQAEDKVKDQAKEQAKERAEEWDSGERGRHLAELRSRLVTLEDNLRQLEERVPKQGDDADDYLSYQLQFEAVGRRRDEIQSTITEAEAARDAAEWAVLETRLDLAWRELDDEARRLLLGPAGAAPGKRRRDK